MCGRSGDEKVVQIATTATTERPGENQAAIRDGGPEPPERAGIVTGAQVKDVRYDRMDMSYFGRPEFREDDRLGRQIERRPAQGD